MIPGRRFILILWLLLIYNYSFGQKPLTLDDCITLAKTNNLELVQAKTAVEQAHTAVLEAYSSFYPNIDLSSGYRYGGDANYSTNIGLRYTLYKGGYIRANVKLADARVKNAEANYRLSESKIVLSVKEAFFEILQKQEQISLIENILGRRKEELVLIKLRYESGRESSPAVKEAEVNLLQAEYDKMLADNELMLVEINLNLLFNRPRKQELSIVHEDKDTEFPALEQLIEEAKNERPEINIEQANREVLAAQVGQARSNYFPTLALSSSYGWQGSEFLEQQRDWSVGLSLSLPIFSGFSRRAQVKKATLSLYEQAVKITALQQSIEEEIEQNYASLKLAEKKSAISQKTLEAAREMYDLTRLQYEQGLTSYFFLQQKESGLTRAEYDYINVLYNLRIARARMEKALGRT